MRCTALFLILLLSGSAVAQGNKSASLIALEQRLVSVEWRLKVDSMPDDFCRELYSFSEDRTLTIASGQEVLVFNWHARTAIDSEAIALSLTAISTNARPDCQGEITALRNTETIRYVNDLQDGRLQLCWRQTKNSCFATLIPLDDEFEI